MAQDPLSIADRPFRSRCPTAAPFDDKSCEGLLWPQPGPECEIRPLAISLALAAVAGLTWKVATPKWHDSGKVARSLSACYSWDGFHRTAIVDG